ncbi:MAG: hypothetical protein AAGD13_11230 [Pseudomonadota bacterium]
MTNFRTICAAIATAGALLGAATTVSANERLVVVADNVDVGMDVEHATVGNLYCGNRKNPSHLIIKAGSSVECSATHAHGVTAISFFLWTEPENPNEGEGCIFDVTNAGVHKDPKDTPVTFHCKGFDVSGDTITVQR